MKKEICYCDICEKEGATTFQTWVHDLETNRIAKEQIDLCDVCIERVFVIVKDMNNDYYIRRD